MKALIVGGGSIGARHLRNLRSLGFDDVAVTDPQSQAREAALRDGARLVFADLAAGLEWRPDVSLITSPSHLHVTQALEAARRDCHLFIEKPLSHSAEGLAELAQEVERRRLVTLVGCNMRFNPGPARVKELLDRQVLGRILFARVHTGSYLPGWRPNQDYRTSYSAQADKGGGCILDCIHEIDLARWFLGDASEVFCVADKRSSLAIDVEDVAILIVRHPDGVIAEIHLDFVQRTYERGCQIVGEDGSILWDAREGSVRWFHAPSERWTIDRQPPGFETNHMYIAEMRHFLDCVASGKQTTLSVPDAMGVMAIALAAKRSAIERQFCSTKGVLS